VQRTRDSMSVKWPDRRHLGLRPWREGQSHRGRCTGGPIELNAFPPVLGARAIYRSLHGTPIDSEDGLVFRVLENIRADDRDSFSRTGCDAYVRVTPGRKWMSMSSKTKEKKNYRSPSNLYTGGDGRGFRRELGA